MKCMRYFKGWERADQLPFMVYFGCEAQYLPVYTRTFLVYICFTFVLHSIKNLLFLPKTDIIV